MMELNPIFDWPFSKMYPMYTDKAEKKGRTKDEVNQIIHWLFGYSETELAEIINDDTTFEQFLMNGPKLNPNRSKITGVVCGVRVENLTDELTKNMRYLDKLIDELAKGKSMEKILRDE